MDINQTKYYIKISCQTYYKKILRDYPWLQPSQHCKTRPIPYSANNAFTKQLETATPPTDEETQRKIAQQFNMHYRKIIGELVWPMVKYRPDYSYHIIKLSQFMANPATEHYKALQDITQHILQTIDHGIYYWRDSPWTDLAEGPLPVASPDNHQFQLDPTTITNNLHGFADSDWGSCCISRNAITGAAIMLAGGDRIQN